VTDIAFWEIGSGEKARIRELHAFLHKQCKLTLYYLGEADKKAQLAIQLEKAEHDFIIVEKLHLDWILNLKNKNIPVYLDAHDLISDRVADFQRFNRSCGTLTLEEEITRLSKFDKVIFLQKEEYEKTLPFLGRERLLLCPHPVVPEEEIEIRETVESIGFFGGPSWPNIDSVQWFHDAVLPLLDDLASKCSVQGAFMFSPFAAFLPGMIKGPLHPTLSSYYRSIDIAINPVLYGSGLKIKTVEALAYGIPLVTTSVGAQGIQEEDGQAFLIADTPEEFAAAIQRLASSYDLRRELSARARHFAKQHFTPHACFSVLLS
jgi:hypothetical protein